MQTRVHIFFQRHPRILDLLIALDFFWVLAATIYDWQKLAATPWYLLPFMPICPIYPLLLAICFVLFKRHGRIPRPLAIFAFMGSVSYGLAAYIFYPLFMSWIGFDWIAVGNMAWVTFYALQAPLLKDYLRLHIGWTILLASYFFTKDILDWHMAKFSYFVTSATPMYVKFYTFLSVLIIHSFLLLWLIFRQHKMGRSA